MRGQPAISPIYRHGQAVEARDPLAEWGRIEHLRRKVWRECGVLVIEPRHLPDDLRDGIEQWARDTYGRR